MCGELRDGRRYRRDQGEYHPEFPVLRNFAEDRHYQSVSEIVRWLRIRVIRQVIVVPQRREQKISLQISQQGAEFLLRCLLTGIGQNRGYDQSMDRAARLLDFRPGGQPVAVRPRGTEY
jgi:hypothetical protein